MPALLVAGMSTAATFIEQLFDSRNKSKKKGKASNKANASSKVKTKTKPIAASTAKKTTTQKLTKSQKQLAKVLGGEEFGFNPKEANMIATLESKIAKAYPTYGKQQVAYMTSLLISKATKEYRGDGSYGNAAKNIPSSLVHPGSFIDKWPNTSGSLSRAFDMFILLGGKTQQKILIKKLDLPDNFFEEAGQLDNQHKEGKAGSVDLTHMMATLATMQKKLPNLARITTPIVYQASSSQLAGWLGDVTNAVVSANWDTRDYKSDLDAVNIYYRLKENSDKTQTQVMSEYYASVTTKSRAAEFLKNVPEKEIISTVNRAEHKTKYTEVSQGPYGRTAIATIPNDDFFDMGESAQKFLTKLYADAGRKKSW
jgi:hypothetical protein